MEVKRGDLFYADLSVGVGSEQSGIRPCRHLCRPGGDRDTVPPSRAHRAAKRATHRQWQR